MKLNFYKKIIATLIALFIGIYIPLQAQTFTYTIKNEVQTANNVLEFDLYLLNKNASTPIEISGIQAGITLNSAIINGGTVTASLVSGYTDMVAAEQPTTITFASATNCIKIAARSGPGAGNGTIMSTTAPGTRYCKVRLTNTVAFASAAPNLTFSFTTSPYPTKLYAYVGGLTTQLTTDATNTYSEVNSFTLNSAPTVTTDSVNSITSITATANGNITSLGSPNPTSFGFCWSSTNSTPTTTDNIVNNGAATATGTFSASITGLAAGTTYYLRAYATNLIGTSYGDVITITTLKPPTVTTGAMSDIADTSATANGNITYLGVPNATAYGVCYSSTNNIPTISDNVINKGAATAIGAFTVPMSQLTSGTTYYVRTYATNSAGTSYGNVVTFTTQKLPIVSTQAVSNIDLSTATGNGNISDLGLPNPTSYGFCWSSINTTPTISNNKKDLGAASATGAFSASLTGLTPGTTYYVRAFASNTIGTSYGQVVSFTTKAPTFTYIIKNDAQTSDKTLEFDLYLLNNNATIPIEISGIQAGITVNPSLANGGTITASIVSGSSELVTAEQPSSITFATNCIKIAPRTGPGAGNGTIISTTAPGTRYCRIKLTNTVAFASVTPDLTFNFTTTPYPTKLYAYESTGSVQLTTNSVNSYSEASNLSLNTEPVITTDSINGINTEMAIGNGNLSYLGAPKPTSYGMCYSTTNSTPTISDNVVDNGAATTAGVFTTSITNLTPGTKYYVRAYATNTIGTSYGSVLTFTTLKVPTVSTQEISNITTTTAIGNGNITDLGNPASITAYGVCYSKTNSTPTTADAIVNNGAVTVTGAFTSAITDLTPGVTYYLRAYATNSVATSYGEVKTFTTQELPTVTTQAVSGISETTAIGNGNITVLGVPNPTAYGVCYSSTNNTPTISDNVVDKGAATVTGAFTASITGLTTGTTYYLRAYATNSVGTSYGEVVTFSTLKVPTVTTQAVTSITTTTAIGNGNITDLGNPASVTSYGICYSSTNNLPTTADIIVNNGTTTMVGAFTSSIAGLAPGTTYYVRAYATNNVGTSYGDVVIFKSLKVPTVTTQAVTNINTTTATGNGNITDLGNPASVKAYGVCYSKINSTPTISDSVANNGATTTTGAFTTSITGLLPGTNYYVRAYATNDGGTSYGDVVIFTTLKLPTVTTQAVSNITTTTATGNGNITVLGVPNPTAYGICYSSSNNTPTISDIVINNGAAAATGAFISSITGLTTGTTYYVRAYATNTAGTTYGEVVTFTTLAVPTVTTQAVTTINTAAATANGTITSLGNPASITAYGICYSSTNALPTTSDVVVNNGATSTLGAFTASITGLTPGTTYYVRTFVTNSVGTSYGSVVTFTSLKLPTVTTPAVTNINIATATGNGNLSDLGNPANITAYGICYSDVNNTPTISDKIVNNGTTTTTGTFFSSLTGLATGTTYYVRAYATNSAGTSYGAVVTFKTLKVPTITTQAVTSITTNTAIANGNLSDLGNPANITAYGFCWSNTNTTPTTSNTVVNKGATTASGAFTASMTGLAFGTTYYVRAFATNSTGTTYGDVVTFTTLALKQLSVKVYLQGMLNGKSMNKCIGDDGASSKFSGTIVDTISVELHNVTNYNLVAYRIHGLELNQDGSLTSPGKTYIEVPAAYSGNYYITIKTRNHIETTSASSVSFAGSSISYDFTTSISKAYGDNMILVGNVAAIYVGDMPTQDGSLDITDLGSIENKITEFATGYLPEDVNGDGVVDISDVAIVETNVLNFVSAILP